MDTTRLEAFSDGVMAILITIMVLELKAPHGASVAELRPLLPVLASYVLSFVYIGIYWNNHHHMLHLAHEVKGGMLWANLHLLFWLSLVPFVTSWNGENHFAATPMAVYGFVLLMAGVAYFVLQLAIMRAQGPGSELRRAVGRDYKGKLSMAVYMAAIPLCYVSRLLAAALYIAVALLWLVPDPRIERTLPHAEERPRPPGGDSRAG